MSKTERQSEVDFLTAQIKASPNVFVTDFSGLNVLKMTEFRRRLRAAGAKYVVVKNTLAQRAVTQLDLGDVAQFGHVEDVEDWASVWVKPPDDPAGATPAP